MNKFDAQHSYQRIRDYKLENGDSLIDPYNYDEIKLQIRANKDVPRGLFKPDPLIPGGHIAHPITIRAMRTDIFVTGHDVDLNEKLINCPDCQHELDLQFYTFCPYCECTQLKI